MLYHPRWAPNWFLIGPGSSLWAVVMLGQTRRTAPIMSTPRRENCAGTDFTPIAVTPPRERLETRPAGGVSRNGPGAPTGRESSLGRAH